MNIRNWNWEVSTIDEIRELIQSIDIPIFVIEGKLSPYQILTQIFTDNELFAKLVAERYGVLKYELLGNISRIGSKPLSLIYLTNALKEANSRIRTLDHRLGSSYERTDVLFCPRTNTGLIRGPEKFGFVKSLILCLLSYSLTKYSLFGAHCSVLKLEAGGIAFIGRHGAGKSTLNLITSICKNDSKLVTDDWGFWSKEERIGLCYVNCICADPNLFVEANTIELLINSIPIAIRRNVMRKVKQLKKISRVDKVIERIDVHIKEYFSDDSIASSSLIKYLFCLSNDSETINNNISQKSFVDFVIDTSYHIPFHSNSSRSNLLRYKNQIDLYDEITIIEDFLSNERLFWD